MWAWRRKKDVYPTSVSELMVNLCLAVTFQEGNQLPTAGATTKSHNKSIQKTTAVTLDLAVALFSTRGECWWSYAAGLSEDLYSAVSFKDSWWSYYACCCCLMRFHPSAAYGHPGNALWRLRGRQYGCLWEKVLHLQKITIESFS